MRAEVETVEPQADVSPWFGWWASLEHRRGDRAALRRASCILEIALEPVFHDLLKRLGSRLNEADRDRVAAIAGLLAHVKKDAAATSFPELMARGQGDKPAVSDARFRRLLRLQTSEELLAELTRVIRMLGGEAPISRLADDVMRWGDDVRKKWALSYYAKTEPHVHK